MTVRVQLRLYVPEPQAAIIHAVRRILDPLQSRLIPAHATLCREDELATIPPLVLRSRLARLPMTSLTLRFGRPQPFSGHGILLPCEVGAEQFVMLRQHLLGAADVRRLAPHITLAHPRNPKVPGNSIAVAESLPDRISISFCAIRWIEQFEGTPWNVLETYAIDAPVQRQT